MFDHELFIESVKARPALYNNSRTKAGNVSTEYWNQIANIIKMDVQECKILWKGLRSSYARHLQFMRQNEQDPKRKPRKPWYLADHMSFLEKYIQVKSKDRLYYKTTKNPNIDDNDNSTTSFSNIEYKSENRTMDESTIKSEELSFRSEVNEEPNTLMKRRESYEENNEELTNMMEYLVRESETENSLSVEKSRIKSSDEDRNETQPAKRIKMDTTVSRLNANKKTIPPREESFLRFLQSLLLDIEKLSNRNLRLFKEDVLKDMNKYLDEQEYSTRVRLFA